MNILPVVLAVAFLVVVVLVLFSIGKFQQPKFVAVKIGNATVDAEVADTFPKQIRGLMFRESLPKDGGMLFVFGSEGRHSIWMMNTSIPLDIIWLDKDKKVIYMKEGAQPCGALAICPSYSPESDAKYVLETNSGYSKRHKIDLGSRAEFDLEGLK